MRFNKNPVHVVELFKYLPIKLFNVDIPTITIDIIRLICTIFINILVLGSLDMLSNIAASFTYFW